MKVPEAIDAPLFGLPPIPSHSSDTITALLWAREVLQAHQTRTYTVRDPKGIEELRPIKIGGVDQWLHIRGRNRNNPVLLFIHGGPGSPALGCADADQRTWEDFFTVVQWDQRQTGKSYYPADDNNNPITTEQFISDTEELIQYLRSYLNKEKIVVVGISWGTVLGMHMAKHHPEWLHAYVGIGQVVNSIEAERVQCQRLLDHAKAKNNVKLIAQLEQIAPYPDPNNLAKSFVEHSVFIRRQLSALAGEAFLHHTPMDEAVTMVSFNRLISPHLTLQDHSNIVFGDEDALIRDPSFTVDFLSTDLPQQIGSSFDVPIFFFTGAHDWQTPVSLSDQWFSEINAPHKKLIHFEESAHIVLNEEPGKFLMALVNNVLPCAEKE